MLGSNGMVRTRVTGLVVLGALLAASPRAQAVWPGRIFAPYVYVGAGRHLKLTRYDDACAQKYYILAFIIAGKTGRPAWDGRWSMRQNLYARQVAAIRRRGGDIIVSFGGAGGKELALTNIPATALAHEYQTVISRYHLSWLDFDIEGSALADQAANKRRNAAVAQLQKRDRGLLVSFTLPANPDGLDSAARQLLSNAVAAGVLVHSVNAMTMDFGSRFIPGRGKRQGQSMGELSIATALAVRRQCRTIDPGIRLGLTPMIGRNDIKTEKFTPADARQLVTWAKAKPWICSLSFWSINLDAGKFGAAHNQRRATHRPFAFTRIFQAFTRRLRPAGGKRPAHRKDRHAS